MACTICASVENKKRARIIKPLELAYEMPACTVSRRYAEHECKLLIAKICFNDKFFGRTDPQKCSDVSRPLEDTICNNT